MPTHLGTTGIAIIGVAVVEANGTTNIVGAAVVATTGVTIAAGV